MKNQPIDESKQKRALEIFERKTKNASEKDIGKVLEKEGKIMGIVSRHLADLFEKINLLFQMLKDYWHGRYRDVPWFLIASIVAAFVYLLSPIDVIPDFIPVIGYVDDFKVFCWVLESFSSTIEKYRKWKIAQEGGTENGKMK